ncbi:hypothetical protein BDF20DRAFT_908188 [Mycotypha africana]|uniref:uncharacterized protein n=1 Tax=Mycotypha africana TaxID=64632 RepID=UPI0022FFE701|nr:uncharacterized protein BDF20DRAFT_908188 [Mycotypha africana]KAI8967864.1 hypothetical protein BDF20DRAFT_908188 [Mycotypha africana]
MSSDSKKRVCYFYDANVGNYHYGPGHPMRPHRIRMCHGLVMNYGLYKKMEIYRAKPANKWEMTQFHTDDYIEFLSRVTPENMDQYQKEQAKFNVGDDSPIFEGLFEYCGLSAGGSMEGAARLNRGLCDIAINWAGGLHHAKKSEASGFCYVNDIVLGILELLRYYARVLYIDIDVHHGDGVEEAFYTTDRVMTVSFHKYGEFFPGTGELKDVGVQKGKYYSVNVPLRDGIDDNSYRSVFEPVIEKVMEWYRPAAVVLQCGGDSLSGDKLGCFNLSMKGHANCVRFVKKFNLPTLVLGGGGYTMRNVARAWAYETGVVVGQEVGPDMPYNDYYEYYGPDYKLDVRPSNMENMNTPDYLEKIKTQVFQNLSRTLFAPGVQMQEVPRDHDMSDDEDDEDPDERISQNFWDRRIVPDNEFYDSDEGESQHEGESRAKKSRLDRNYDEDGKYTNHSNSKGSNTSSPLPTHQQHNLSKEEEDEIAKVLEEQTDQQQQQNDYMLTDSSDRVISAPMALQHQPAVDEDVLMTEAITEQQSTLPTPPAVEDNVVASYSFDTNIPMPTETQQYLSTSSIAAVPVTAENSEVPVANTLSSDRLTTASSITEAKQDSNPNTNVITNTSGSKNQAKTTESEDEEGEVKSVKSMLSSVPTSPPFDKSLEQNTIEKDEKNHENGNMKDSGEKLQPTPSVTFMSTVPTLEEGEIEEGEIAD